MTRRLQVLDGLEKGWRGCSACDLHKSRSKVVFWRGNPEAKIVVVGGSPRIDEDERGLPFAGENGRVLDDVLRLARLDPPEDIFAIDMVGCRPPRDISPTPDQVAACAERTHAMIMTVNPRVLVLMGGVAARLAGVSTVNPWRGSIMESCSFLLKQGKPTIPAVITWHPSLITGGVDRLGLQRNMVSDIKVARSVANR